MIYAFNSGKLLIISCYIIGWGKLTVKALLSAVVLVRLNLAGDKRNIRKHSFLKLSRINVYVQHIREVEILYRNVYEYVSSHTLQGILSIISYFMSCRLVLSFNELSLLL